MNISTSKYFGLFPSSGVSLPADVEGWLDENDWLLVEAENNALCRGECGIKTNLFI